MSVRSADRERREALVRELLEIRAGGQKMSCHEFVESRKLKCHLATFCRWVQEYTDFQRDGVEVLRNELWSILPQGARGAYIGLLDLHADPVRNRRKREKRKSVAAVIRIFKEWFRKAGLGILEVSDFRLNEIARHRSLARRSLDGQGSAAYKEVCGKWLTAAYEKQECLQMDVTELFGPFLTSKGVGERKVYILLAICVATKVIVGWSYHFVPCRISHVGRLVYGILSGTGPEISGFCGGPIGYLKCDNGIFQSPSLRDLLERMGGICIEYNDVACPQQNGVIEKTIGDLKRNVVSRLERVFHNGESYILEDTLVRSLQLSVGELNTGRGRGKSPFSLWGQTPPLSGVPPGWFGKATANAFLDHHDIRFRDGNVHYDTEYVTRGDRIPRDGAARCFVRQHFRPGKLPELFLVTPLREHKRLCSLHPISRTPVQKGANAPMEPGNTELVQRQLKLF